MKTYLLLLFSALLCFTNITSVAGQQNETRLAQQYFADGEYEKAASLYERLFEKYKNDYYYGRYINCLILLEEFKTAEASLKKQIKKFPKKGEYHIHFGNLLEKQFQTEAADEEFRKAIKLLNPDRNEISRLASAFRNLAKYDLAIETYDKGGKLLKDKSIFAYNTGDLYRRKGDMPKMIQYYLDDVSVNVARINTIQTYFQRYLDEKDFTSLKTQLYTRIQEEPDVLVYPEMLIWMFIQQKDFKSALRQVKALDRRLEENGNRVFN
ncbi:MAG: tetratricopeptide repeat protein, partial [Bacteroidota bacterium]